MFTPEIMGSGCGKADWESVEGGRRRIYYYQQTVYAGGTLVTVSFFVGWEMLA